VAKKLIDIEKSVDNSASNFKDYLKNNFNPQVIGFFDKLSEKTDIYIFSGVIRNYFLKIPENRDIDLFMDGYFDIDVFLEKYEHKKNNFGGYKISLSETTIDIWFLKDTWAIKEYQLVFDFDLPKHIPNTSFFNFSSIIYSCRENKFYYTKHFIRFLRDKTIDLLYLPNANYSLCVINTIYYSEKYKLKVSGKLKSYIKNSVKNGLVDVERVQKSHFGRIIYPLSEIKHKIEML
jgi:hypothetical protein